MLRTVLLSSLLLPILLPFGTLVNVALDGKRVFDMPGIESNSYHKSNKELWNFLWWFIIITVNWIKGHAGIPGNERADNLARKSLEATHNIFKRDAKDHAHWNYEENAGPSHWPKMFKKCGGAKQSPIDIISSQADYNDKLNEFIFSDNYDDPIEGAIIQNNGHTIIVKPGPKDLPRTIDEGGLDDEYQFEQLHFHWGSDSKQGSEHLIDGKAFPLEMHLVHRNKDYKTMEAAAQKEDGLAVLSVLFKLDDEDNKELEAIIDKLDDVREEGDSAELDDSFQLHSLMPDDFMPYYRYKGSLTTPPCNEVVIWTVFKDYVPISERQLNLFRNVKEEEEGEPEEYLLNNFRPVQPLGTRVVQVSGEEDDNSASIATPAAMLALSAIAFFL